MRKIFFFLLAVATLSLIACNNNASIKDMNDSSGNKMQSSSGNANLERNKQNVLALYDAMEKNDINGCLSQCSDDVKDFGDESGKPMVGKDSMKAFFQMWMKAFPDFKVSNKTVLADGDWVVVRGENSGTWKGDFMGQKPTGKSFKFYDADFFKVNDQGKITQHHGTQGISTLAQQIGMKMQ